MFVIEVVDENGQDVTPLPLSQIDTNALRKNQANVVGESSAATVSINIKYSLKNI